MTDRAMTDESLSRKSARELAALIKSRAASPVEVLDAHLAVIARVNPKLNAIVTLVADKARAAAQAAEAAVMRGGEVGALHGLPLAVGGEARAAGASDRLAAARLICACAGRFARNNANEEHRA